MAPWETQVVSSAGARAGACTGWARATGGAPATNGSQAATTARRIRISGHSAWRVRPGKGEVTPSRGNRTTGRAAPMNELRALRSLARAMGVHTRFTDGLGRRVIVASETLVRVCAALGAHLARPGDAAEALRAYRALSKAGLLPPVLVAWDGVLPPLSAGRGGPVHAELRLESGGTAPLDVRGAEIHASDPLPMGYHQLDVETAGTQRTTTVIAAPVQAWRREGPHRRWALGPQPAAETAGTQWTTTVSAARVQAWRREGPHRSWGLGPHLAALRSA